MVGLIGKRPSAFSVAQSVLEGDCFSMMRDEMVTFKCLVEVHLPELHSKLQNLGMPVELLVY